MFVLWLKWQDNVTDEEYGKPSWRRLIKVIAKLDEKFATKIENSTPWL